MDMQCGLGIDGGIQIRVNAPRKEGLKRGYFK
jgi:hypothetical protein